MRNFLTAAFITIFLAVPAGAAKKQPPKDQKQLAQISKEELDAANKGAADPSKKAKPVKKGAKEKENPPRGSMDSGDPVAQEESETGPYTPKSAPEPIDELPREILPGRAKKLKHRPPRLILGQLVVGFGGAPLPGTSEAQTGKTTSLTFLLGGYYEFQSDLILSLRLPITTATVRISNQDRRITALGGPELLLEYRAALDRATAIPIRFGIGIPIAQGDMDPTTTDRDGYARAMVNAVADASLGYRDGIMFAPKHVPIAVGVGIHHERVKLDLDAATKFEFLINYGGDIRAPHLDPLSGSLTANSVGVRSVTEAGLHYEITDKLEIGLETWMVYNLIEPVEFEAEGEVSRPSRLQFLVQPQIGYRLGEKFIASLGYILPLGGHLGHFHSGSLVASANYLF